MATCFLIDSVAASAGCAAARFARLRGARLVPCVSFDALPEQLPQSSMIALSASRMRQLAGRHKSHLANLVGEGATLYLRGVAPRSPTIDLRPFAPVELAIAGETRAIGYRFTASRMLPAVLAGEEMADGLFDAPGVERRLNSGTEELLTVRHVDGIERTAIFVLGHGSGCVVYDLHPEEETDDDAPIVARLARREVRHQDAGALVAANRSAGMDPARLPPFNLVVDDRPANFDHFNAAPVSALLRHIESLCPGAHTDFAWTPRHARPCRRYLDAMKEFPIGFVWHGLCRHVDHRLIKYPAGELEDGRRMVARIERRYGIRLQPIIIFPFERSAPKQFELLARAGFLASVEQPRHPSCIDPHQRESPLDSLPARTDPVSGLTVLYRYPAMSLTRERMLAMAALGLPIIAFAHPDEVGLKRFSRFWDRGGDPSHFDEVLKFAASKGLPSRSLEDIAIEVGNVQSTGDQPAQAAPMMHAARTATAT
jgi:hypothetical protein